MIKLLLIITSITLYITGIILIEEALRKQHDKCFIAGETLIIVGLTLQLLLLSFGKND